MAEMTDYQILSSSEFTLAGNVGTKSFGFVLPPDLSLSGGGILTFVVTNVESVKFGTTTTTYDFDLTVNQKKLKKFGLSPDFVGMLSKTFSAQSGTLKGGLSNSVKFASNPAGQIGSVTISDVVIWFQRNI